MLTYRVLSKLCITLVLLDAAFSQQVPTPPALVQSLPVTTQYYSPNSGETLTLPCVATGQPKPDYGWTLNGQMVNDKPTQDGTLVYTSPDLSKQGYYQCTARNSLGVVQSNVTLVLRADQAQFDQTDPISRATVVGKSLLLRCQPRKNAVPIPRQTHYNKGYDWRYDDDGSSFPLGPRARIDDNGNLNIAYVTLADNRPSSSLTCYITNSISKVSVGGSSVMLTVTDDGTATDTRPTIMFYTNQTLNLGGISTTVVALEGRNTSLRCFFSGRPDLTVTWSKLNGQIPTDGRVERLSSQTELFIKNVHLSDEGTYTCTGSGSAVGSTDFPVNLIVRAVPVFKLAGTGPRNTNATVGEDVQFYCQPYANPEATVVWYLNGVALDPSQSTLLSRFRWSNNNKVLTVLNVCKDNCSATANGPMVIQCNASNQYGYTFANGFINVYIRTVMTSAPKTVVGALGQMYTFNASATSDPNTPVTFSWYLKRDKQQEERRIVTSSDNKFVVSSDGNSLTVNNADESTFGHYRVVASNGISEQSAEFDLYPPTIMAYVWPFWWIPLVIIIIVLLFVIIVLIVCCCIYRNRGDEYHVDEKEREADHNPEQELADNGFQVHHRPTNRSNDIEKQPLTTLERR